MRKKGSTASDTSPLIYLAKANELNLLEEVFEEVYVPLPVYEETQEKSYLEDAVKIKEAGFLKICPLTCEEEELVEKICGNYNMGEIDCSVISVYFSKGLDYALFANTGASKVAKKLNVNVIDPFELGKIKFTEINSLEDYILKLKSAGYFTKQMKEFLDQINLSKSSP